MKYLSPIFIFLCLCPTLVFGKIGFGAGFDLNPNSARVSIRNWFSKFEGAEIGFGPTADFEDFKFDDMSIQAKFLKGIRYNRYIRTYVGIIGRYTIVKDPHFDKNLISAGVLAGNEWYIGKYRNQGIAVEVGYLYGKSKGQTLVWENGVQETPVYKEFPVHICFSYKYYF